MKNNEQKASSNVKGDSFVWLTSLGLTTGLVMVGTILIFILVKGLAAFWPADIAMVKLKQDSNAKINNSLYIAGEEVGEKEKIVENADGTREEVTEKKFYVANRDIFNFSFVYINEEDIDSVEYPENLMVIERLDENRGMIIPKKLVFPDGKEIKYEDSNFQSEFDRLYNKYMGLHETLYDIQRNEIRPVTKAYNELKIQQYKYYEAMLTDGETIKAVNKYRDNIKKVNESFNGFLALSTAEQTKNMTPAIKDLLKLIEEAKSVLMEKTPEAFVSYESLQKRISEGQLEERSLTIKSQKMEKELHEVNLEFETAPGLKGKLKLGNVVKYAYPNRLSTSSKMGLYMSNIWGFLSENPRRANSEGGVFPAIIGTLFLTILMCVFVTPFGVIAAIFLHEYAKQGPVVRVVRIAINNLAGVPSIVYGAFGMAFFIYYIGGSIDELFYSDRINSGVGPKFGTGGMLWASLTLALLTVPVVIVATEEALAAVPRGIREGAFGCGASKWQMIKSVVLPASAPGIITGMILAMARGAGEVAPLMLVGVADAAEMSLESSFPYGVEKQFLHLGYNIYHVGFKATDSEAAQPLVFATTLLLITIVALLNLAGIIIRQKLRKKYASGAF